MSDCCDIYIKTNLYDRKAEATWDGSHSDITLGPKEFFGYWKGDKKPDHDNDTDNDTDTITYHYHILQWKVKDPSKPLKITADHELLFKYYGVANAAADRYDSREEHPKSKMENILLESKYDSAAFIGQTGKLFDFISNVAVTAKDIYVYLINFDDAEGNSIFQKIESKSSDALSKLKIKLNPVQFKDETEERFKENKNSIFITDQVIDLKAEFDNRKLAFVLQDPEPENSLIFPPGNEPVLWYSSSEKMPDLIGLYLDFYYFRPRYKELWEECLEQLTFDDVGKAKEFLGLSRIFLQREQEFKGKENRAEIRLYDCPNTVVKDNDAEIQPYSCDIGFPSNANWTAGTAIGGASADGNPRDTVSASVPNANSDNCYIYQKGKKLSKYGSYSFTIGDNRHASKLILAMKFGNETIWTCEVSRYRKNCNCNLITIPKGENVSISHVEQPYPNGTYDPGKDPVTFSCNGKTITSAACRPITDEVGKKYEISVATRSSGLSVLATFQVIHRNANALMVNIKPGGKCSEIPVVDKYDKDNPGLSKNKRMSRVKKISCRENSTLNVEANGVFYDKPQVSDELYYCKKCEFSVISDSGNFNQEPVADDAGTVYSGRLKPFQFRPGIFTLTIREPSSGSCYEIDFDVWPDYTGYVLPVMAGSLLLSLLTRFCWYGLNFWTFLLYSICPLAAGFVLTQKKIFFRKPKAGDQWGRVPSGVTWASVIFAVIFLLTAFMEELR